MSIMEMDLCPEYVMCVSVYVGDEQESVFTGIGALILGTTKAAHVLVLHLELQYGYIVVRMNRLLYTWRTSLKYHSISRARDPRTNTSTDANVHAYRHITVRK
jgi:hypothetical protein